MSWADEPLDRDFPPCCLVFDTETTGLTLHPHAPIEKQPKIIEFGGVLMSLETGDIVMEFNHLIHPGEAVSAEITKITGITNEMLVREGSFVERWPTIRKLFSAAKAVCAHNLPFDRAMVQNDVARWRLDGLRWPGRESCTMNMYAPLYGRNPKLIELYRDTTGKEHAQTHRAIDDVKLMIEIIQKEALWKLM